MTETGKDVVLGYLAARRGRLPAFAGVLLVLWGIFDFFLGPMLVMGTIMIASQMGGGAIVLGFAGILLGVFVFIYSAVAMACGVRMLRGSADAASDAFRFTRLAEVVSWVVSGGWVLWVGSVNIFYWGIVFVAMLGILLAVRVTRVAVGKVEVAVQ